MTAPLPAPRSFAQDGAIVVVGEALVDEVRRADGVVAPHPGGSPANVALGLSRLGAKPILVTSYGKDPYGDLLREHLESNGVAVWPSAEGSAPTSVAAATLDAAGVATYDFRIRWELEAIDPDVLSGVLALHTGSLATALEPGAGAVRDLIRSARGRVPVSYDPNLRPALLGDASRVLPDVEALVAEASIVKVSVEDLAWLLPDEGYSDVAARWLGLGPAIVVVTLGGEGAYAVSRRGPVERPGVPVQVVDTVGAGDSFTAGLLDGLRGADLLGQARRAPLRSIDEATLGRVLDEAIRVSAINCTRAGADPPTRAELAASTGQG